MKPSRTMQRSILFMVPGLCAAVACAAADTGDEPRETPPDTTDAARPEEDAPPPSDCDAADGCAPVDCASADFCVVQNPLTAPIAVNAISGTAPDDIWFAGSRGALLHYDGKELRAIDTHSRNALVAVWASERHSAWVAPLESAPLHVIPNAAGGSDVVSVPGDVWPDEPENIGRVWAIGGSAEDVWLVGDPALYTPYYNQLIRRLGSSPEGGVTWNSPLTDCPRYSNCGPALRAFYSFSATSAWAVGAGGGLRLGAGDSGVVWTPYVIQGQTIFEGVWGARADSVWAVGTSGAIARFVATGEPRWEPVTSPVTGNLHAIWGSADDDIWAVGDRGRVLHYDGMAWRVAESGLPANRREANLFGIWGSGPDDIWIGGDGVLLHRTTQNRRRP